METIEFSLFVQKILKDSIENAKNLGNKRVATPHYLLSLIKSDKNLATEVLINLDCDIEKLKKQIVTRLSDRNNKIISNKDITTSENANKVLVIAKAEAKKFISPTVEPEHILLALAKDKDFLSAQILDEFEITYSKVFDEIRNLTKLRDNQSESLNLKERSTNRPKKLFRVASEFNVATQTLTDILNEAGYKIANRPNTKITHQMYDVLEEYYRTKFDGPVPGTIDQEIHDLLGIPYLKGSSLSEEDFLGRENLVQSIASMIASPKQETPFTIGLLGDWGSGKSNVMYLLRKALHERADSKRFYFTDFNAWQYEHTDNITAGLAQEVLNGLIDRKKWHDKIKVRLEFGYRENGWLVPIMIIGLFVLLGISISLALNTESQGWIALTVTTFILLGALIKKITTIFGHPFATKVNSYLKLPSYADHLGTIPMLKRHLKSLCDIVIPTDDSESTPRLVVFVDDLDRCEPETISKTLDAIRLVMDIDNVVVVIGIDHRIAFRAVEKQYKELADDKRTSSDIAREYLGKIIQLPITLNEPSVKELNNFISFYLFSDVDDEVRNKNDSGSRKAKTTKQVELSEGLDKSDSAKSNPKEIEQNEVQDKKRSDNQVLLNQDMQETLDEREYFSDMCNLFETKNPRQLIRLKNCYRLLKRLSNGSEYWMEKMTMLFWLEFLYGQKRESRIAIEKCFANQNFEDVIRCSKEGHLNQQIIDELESVFLIFENDFSIFNEIKSQVIRLVLPHSESYERAHREEINLNINNE